MAAIVAEERGWRFVLNPAPVRPVPLGVLARCDVLTPNAHEARALGEVDELLAHGVGAVVVTRAEEGADVHRPGHLPWHRHRLHVDVVDTTGAGDSFNGALAWSLAEGERSRRRRQSGGRGRRACVSSPRSQGQALPDRTELITAIWAGR